jgi:hypothetical protein
MGNQTWTFPTKWTWRRSRAHEADRAKDIELAGAQGIDAALKEHKLDALLFPGAGGAAIAAKPISTVIVPFGLVPNDPKPPFPDGFDAKPGRSGQLHGNCVQRTASDRVGLWLRAGDKTARAAGFGAVSS